MMQRYHFSTKHYVLGTHIFVCYLKRELNIWRETLGAFFPKRDALSVCLFCPLRANEMPNTYGLVHRVLRGGRNHRILFYGYM